MSSSDSDQTLPPADGSRQSMLSRFRRLVQSLTATTTLEPGALPPRLKNRYEIQQALNQHGEVYRYRGLDHGAANGQPVPVVIVRAKVHPAVEPPPVATEFFEPKTLANDDEILPDFDPADVSLPATGAFVVEPAWPGAVWEEILLGKAKDATLPSVLDSFVEGDWEYLVEELPMGRPLWDAWNDPAATAAQRFGWLRRLAEGLRQLHLAGAIFESLRPDIVIITPAGLPRLADLSGLLPLPLPADLSPRATPYTAPELILSGDKADARADLFGFGAMLCALHLGRALTASDFEEPGFPKPFLAQFPDAHPVLGRLLAKTFCRDVAMRFPTDETCRTDPTGFTDLIRALEVCGRTLDNVRLEIAAWTTTGMVRTGNEDAFALLHAVEAGQDDLAESALILLADGMGGYEAGEVAAALAVGSLRRYLLQHPLFALMVGEPLTTPYTFDLETCRAHLRNALREANQKVYQAARSGAGGRGMGCTAEAVYVNGRYVVVGHVGDSRTYHLHQGRLIQLTQDQTLVNRLVELGTLTPKEAETHPRRSELQQAIGGHADVEPALYHAALKPGDWVVICSDGLSNPVAPPELQQLLLSETTSAEMAARRLINFANLKGALDNATVVVVRAI